MSSIIVVLYFQFKLEIELITTYYRSVYITVQDINSVLLIKLPTEAVNSPKIMFNLTHVTDGEKKN